MSIVLKNFLFMFTIWFYLYEVFNQRKHSKKAGLAETEIDTYCAELLKSGFNIKNTTNSLYVNAFIEGKCPPVVLVPGFIGTKLEFVMTNSTLFGESHRDIVKKCGWKDLKAKELKRFTLFINTDIDFMSIAMQDQEESSKTKKKSDKPHIPHFIKKVKIGDSEKVMDIQPGCWGSLFRVYYSLEAETGKLKVEPLKGARIQPKISEGKERCGADSISNFLDSYSGYVKFTKAFNDIQEKLQSLGYKHGLSLFSFPYDWRLPPLFHEEKLNKTLNLAYTINKKKPIIIAHSMGGLLAYNLALKNKDIIERVITIGTPFLGSPKAIESKLTPDKQLSFNKKFNALFFEVEVETEVDPVSNKFIAASSMNYMTFYPKPTVKDEVDQNIDEAMKKIYPSKSEVDKCIGTIEYLDRKTVCKLPEHDAYSHSIFSHGKEEVYFKFEKELVDYLEHHKYYDEESVLKFEQDEFLQNSNLKLADLLHHRHIQEEGKSIFTYKNPEVPFVFIYENSLPMPSRYELATEDGKTIISKIVKNTPGDGTVDALSSVYPGMRWVSEYDLIRKGWDQVGNDRNFKDKSEASFHFVEYCASHKEHDYTTFNPKKSQYISLSCECIQTKKPPTEECNHTTILSDKYIGNFIEKVIKSQVFSKQLINEKYSSLYNRKYTKDLFCKNLFR